MKVNALMKACNMQKMTLNNKNTFKTQKTTPVHMLPSEEEDR